MKPTDRPPPDWQLPQGVNRGLWDYLHSQAVAQNYDDYLAGSSLPAVDEAFVAEHCVTPGRLVDLGCGTGRLLVAASKCGHRVLGVDLSLEMLTVADAKAAAAGLTIDRLQANITELECLADESFDYAACLFSTLGMVVGSEQRRRVLGHAHRLLRSGGRFVLHVHNRWFNVWSPQACRWSLQSLWRSALRRPDAGDCVMPAHQGIAAGLTLHLFTRGEAVQLLRESGFRIAEVRPVSLRPDGRLGWPAFLAWLRAYGYLIASERGR
jgi:SAM-dependent methyltransferase